MFSELVDRAVHIAGRPDALEDIAYAANEICRDISKREDWADDVCEEEVVVPAGATSVIWDPEVGRSRFRREEFIIDGCGCQPDRVMPSRRMIEARHAYYYGTGGSFAFNNVCSPLRMFYYAYRPWLMYYPKGSRPTEFNVELGAFNDPAKADLVSNWMLERHNKTVLAGTLMSFFAGKQDPRQSVHFSTYEQGITHIIRSESHKELVARK